jgi:hypothetical protein
MSTITTDALTQGDGKTPVPPTKESISQSYWSLVWYKFKRNKLAIAGGALIILF